MKRRITAAALAGATALSLAVAPTTQAEENPDILDTLDKFDGKVQEVEKKIRTKAERFELREILQEKGTGAAPDTQATRDWVYGSVENGSSAEEAYRATQVGWILTWIAVATADLGAIGYGAKAVGVLPPQVAQALPF
ncbi:hypothetical protein HMPREF3170_02080 [Corynebacterium sp. HMSC08D02]|uniref:hypothetical protein n=1 Tax=Corynebacterium sp. HMSC08D02 TaxID=1581138 RepID=UPI0008A17B09|nr:hypothetical protein [Corynebacterium sp. HMSC08D02]OFT31027.1 hypothetical protein HMPREF3170_02080 [Corynebacterium sp. HMSC08D02]